jgi:23S rRNA pseudouridine2605 synthase
VRLWKIYKPIKYICSTKDEQNRKIIFDLVPKNLPRMISIGRLDFMSEGLLLLTNNGDYSRSLELPSKGYERVYRVCLRGQIKKEDVDEINKGMKINNVNYERIKIKIDKSNNNFTWIIVKLKEGKNREIRNICMYFSWKIVKLIRIQYGPYKLEKLKEGQIQEIKVIKYA